MKAVLPMDLQSEFELVGEHADRVLTGWGEITFSKLTKQHAESLIERGYLGIRKKVAVQRAAVMEPIEAERAEVSADEPQQEKPLRGRKKQQENEANPEVGV